MKMMKPHLYMNNTTEGPFVEKVLGLVEHMHFVEGGSAWL